MTYQGEVIGLSVRSILKLWDVASGTELGGPPPHWSDVEVLAFAPDGKTIAAATPEGPIEIRDAATGQVRGQITDPGGRVMALAFGADGRLFSGSLDTTVLAWDPRAVTAPPADRH